MSTNTQTQKNTIPEQWRPKRREHGGLRQVRRDSNKQLTFKGQEKDEVVKRVVRQHALFLVRPALPAVGIALALVLDSFLLTKLPEFATLWGLFDLVLAFGLLIAVGYFLWKDFFTWWVDVDIITNKRIISCQGFLQPTRKIVPLDKISQISVHQDHPWNIFLSYGTVHIYLAGGELILKRVPRPQEVRDTLNGIHQDFKAAVKPAEKLPTIADPEISSMLIKLGKKADLPSLPNADERYSHLHDPKHLRRPMRRFGGPLRIPAEVTYSSDEHTVMYIQRSKWLLWLRLIPPGIAVLAALVSSFIFPMFAGFTVTLALVLLVFMGLLTINYVDDVFILTNKRVIDIERKFIFFYEERVEAEYKNIRDTKIKITNIFQNMFDIGNVYIETPGNNPDINITLVDHPYFIADRINQVRGFKENFDKAKAKNDRQDELNKWFTNVVSVLEKKITSRGVPNLRTMDLWSAAALAAGMGMKVIPVGEDDSYPQIEPGKIVAQEPLPGTLMEVDSDSGERPEIHVFLSKRG